VTGQSPVQASLPVALGTHCCRITSEGGQATDPFAKLKKNMYHEGEDKFISFILFQ
jgi:hypothetical protein